ncbi:hypothetical protein LOD99_16299 [Oopsacas minuta]|uniref:cyclin-dependent kinase n=1 Tax=Oopsacas minuta TaxID=111878 RepID=A0AAV7K722_9METZ|nr:hypothetical protein LOD99_16299 [Oopsacas minuta]
MEKYENLGMVGEGSYGMVMKCKHKETKQLVAIKKFIESEDDRMVSKIAKREVKMLQSLRHVNLVSLLEVFRKKKRLYLVFEYVERTVLDDLEKHPMGLSFQQVCGLTWQVLNGVDFIHNNNIIHRDIKPENVLISSGGVVKLCDFGFARFIAGPSEKYTDYVATRWYRAPELLVGDVHYDKGVDIWATGCLISEMLTGEPLFPGDSDIDQIYHITKCLGNLITRHREIFSRNPLFQGVRLPTVRRITSFEKRYPKMKSHALAMIKLCLKLEPKDRPGCAKLLEEEFFANDTEYIPKYKKKLSAQMFSEFKSNVLIQKLGIKPAGYPVLKDQEPDNQLQPAERDRDRDKERERRRERKRSKRESVTMLEAKDLRPVTPIKRLSARKEGEIKSGRKSPKISLADLKIKSPPMVPPTLSKPQRREFRDDESIPSGRNTAISNLNLYEPNPLPKPYSPQKFPPSLYEPPLYSHFKRDSPPTGLPPSQLRIGLEVTVNPRQTVDPQMFNYAGYAPSIASRSEVSTIYMDKIKVDLPTDKPSNSEPPFRYVGTTNKPHSIRTNFPQSNVTLPLLNRGAGSRERSTKPGPIKAVHPYETPISLTEPVPVGYKGMGMDPFQTGAGMRIEQPSLDDLSETRSTQAESSSLPNV